MTAHHCLTTDGPVAGRTVLVAGGAGAVGHFANELARHGGARSATTVSSHEKAAMAQAAGQPSSSTSATHRRPNCCVDLPIRSTGSSR